MKMLSFSIVFLFSFILGAITHESDISRNCKEKGYSAAWVYEINCGDNK